MHQRRKLRQGSPVWAFVLAGLRGFDQHETSPAGFFSISLRWAMVIRAHSASTGPGVSICIGYLILLPRHHYPTHALCQSGAAPACFILPTKLQIRTFSRRCSLTVHPVKSTPPRQKARLPCTRSPISLHHAGLVPAGQGIRLPLGRQPNSAQGQTSPPNATPT